MFIYLALFQLATLGAEKFAMMKEDIASQIIEKVVSLMRLLIILCSSLLVS